MKKLMLITSALMLVFGTTNAKIGLGPEVGVNFASMKYTPAAGTVTTSGKMGFKAGIIANAGIGKISIQPGIFYTGKGGTINTTEVSANYVEIPVNIQYDIVGLKVITVFAGAGPYFGYALGGKMKTGATEADLKIGTDSASSLKPMDMGVNVNVGVRLMFGVFARLQYGMGLTNNAPVAAVTNKNGVFTVSVGYMLGF